MGKIFTVEFQRLVLLAGEIDVEAENKDEAVEKAWNAYISGEVRMNEYDDGDTIVNVIEEGVF